MKKFLALALTLGSVGLAATSAEAASSSPAATMVAMKAAPAPVQWRNRNWRRSRVRVTTQTRLVRRGRQVWRETYQVRYLPNGSAQTRLISRVRVR